MRKNIRIELNETDFRDRVYACWLGKNIGGTMGTPFEGRREILDIPGFTTAPGKPLPNDDLDLQLVWLHAVEQMGPLAIDAATLGEFWVEMITPHWNEYAIGKNNIKRGIPAPMSGDYQNTWQHSNGAWIRTEVWACMAPGCPAIAAKYAMEDAKVDHGAGEGTVAAAFVAALQSAAFVVRDLRACTELALASIPAESRMADSIRFLLECYDGGMSWVDARNAIQQRNADIGDGWFEAPSNVSYAVIGLLWGEGDFKRSMITAINCGDDTDCTGATVGATLGILGGTAAIPQDWAAHIGDEIITISINHADAYTGRRLPKTCTELTTRVVDQAPFVLFANHAPVALTAGAERIPGNAGDILAEQCKAIATTIVHTPYVAQYRSSVLSATVVLSGAPEIEPNGTMTLSVTVTPNRALGDPPYNLNLRWWLPEGFTVKGPKHALINNTTSHTVSRTTITYVITAGEEVSSDNRCVLEILPLGRSTPLYVPVLLLG